MSPQDEHSEGYSFIYLFFICLCFDYLAEGMNMQIHHTYLWFHRIGLGQSQTKMHVWAVLTESKLHWQILYLIYVSAIASSQDAHQ